MSEFKSFEKIFRLNRDITITEKLDGTNAQIHIAENGIDIEFGSRNRWLVPGDDNKGFAKWGCDNYKDLLGLGPGRHFGEWWGQGIGRKYGLDHKRFSLFNTFRWSDEKGNRPDCCCVTPVIYEGPMSTDTIEKALNDLILFGSHAVAGFMNPEGIVVFHQAANMMFKVTCKNDDKPKSEVRLEETNEERIENLKKLNWLEPY